jgi:hypothetical protein
MDFPVNYDVMVILGTGVDESGVLTPSSRERVEQSVAYFLRNPGKRNLFFGASALSRG